MKEVYIYTDGACSKNPGPGGWAYILKYKDHILQKSGGEKYTTNNRMEISGVINALKALNQPCSVKIYTDSKYVVDSICKGWAKKWKNNNWMKNKKEKALNIDLWETLLTLIEKHDCEFFWIKGHAGHPENEKCDKMATNEYKKFIK